MRQLPTVLVNPDEHKVEVVKILTPEEAAEAVCHKEQMVIWTDEFLEHLLPCGYLRKPASYQEVVELHQTLETAIRDVIGKAFDHPEVRVSLVKSAD